MRSEASPPCWTLLGPAGILPCDHGFRHGEAMGLRGGSVNEGPERRMSTTVPIDGPQPSQLLVDGARLRSALDWFDFDAVDHDPVPVLRLDDDRVLADGHTRALLAYLSGAETLEVVPDPDRPDRNRELYRECVSWCRADAVTAVDDLVGRVVSRETFLEEWVARCRASPHAEPD